MEQTEAQRRFGALMTLFAHLLCLNPEWQKCKKRILRLVRNPWEKEEAERSQKDLICKARVEAEAEVIVSPHSFFQVMRRESANSSLVFLGLNIPDEGKEVSFFEGISSNLEEMPSVLLIKSALDENITLS